MVWAFCIHQGREKILVERAPVDADPYGLVIVERDLDDRPEILVTPLSADIAGVDSILGEDSGGGGIPTEKQMPIVVEITDERDRDTHISEPARQSPVLPERPLRC